MMPLRRVSIVVISLSPELGGGYTGIINLAKCLANRGTTDVTILTIDKVERNYSIGSIKVVSISSFIHKRIPSLSILGQLPYLFRSDLIYLHSFNSPISLLVYIFSFWTNIPILFRPHGSLMDTYTSRFSLTHHLFVRLQALIYSLRSTFIFSSELESRQSLAYLSSFRASISSVIIPEPFPSASKDPYSDKDRPIRFLYVGRIVPAKGIVDYLYSLLDYFDSHPHTLAQTTVITLAGSSSPSVDQQLVDLSSSLSRHSIKLENLGFVTSAKRDSLLRSSHYFLHPTTGDCFGISVLEAVFSGCHVLSSSQLGICKELLYSRAMTTLSGPVTVADIITNQVNPPPADLEYLSAAFSPHRVCDLYTTHFSK